ncbi:MAG: response regulator [Caldiserica bacterium]|nr:response regulator [Caldisericota bacterium]
MERKVLVVDDDIESLRLYGEMLRRAGYAAVTASTGWEGIDLAVKEHPGLILLDLRLPDITGLTVLETLRTALSTRNIPIIVVSAISKDDDVMKAMQMGAFDYVVKPITYDDMIRRVELVFFSHERQGEGDQSPVLIVEDSTIDGASLSEQLTSWGYQVTWVQTGREGIAQAATGNFDVILMDGLLPDINGFEVVKEIRATERLGTTPVIMLTVLSGLVDKLKGFESGVDEFLNKPVSWEELRVRIRSLTRLRGMAKQRFALSEVVGVITNAIELAEATEPRHNQKVASISVILGKRLGVQGHGLWVLEMAGSLHDVGKLVVRREVLFKPGKLDPSEWAEIQRHSEYGERIIRPIHGFDEIADIVRHHHEKADGSGYPDHLKGDQVSLLVRIVGVSDSFEALTSDRPYRPAFPRDQALEILHREMDEGHWDPQVIAALSSSLDELDNL